MNDDELIIAASIGNIEMIDCYLLRGASPLAVSKDSEKRTAIMASMSNHKHACTKLLLPLSNVDQTESDGWTAIHYAARHKETIEMFKHLLTPERINKKARDGTTPLMMAVICGNSYGVDLMLPMADIDLVDRHGRLAESYETGNDGSLDCCNQVKAWRERMEIEKFVTPVTMRSAPRMRM